MIGNGRAEVHEFTMWEVKGRNSGWRTIFRHKASRQLVCLCMCLRVHKCLIFPGNKSRNPDNGVDMSRDTVKDKVTKESQNEWRERARKECKILSNTPESVQ